MTDAVTTTAAEWAAVGFSRIALGIEYRGSRYHGFQRQNAGVPSVQACLEQALSRVAGGEVLTINCAGRTDAGVHAVAQYISVPVTDAELACTRRRWLRAMDALLPKDIAINEVYKARKGFSARFDARSRTYTYRIADRDARPVLSRGAVWWHRYPLDVEAMSAACPALLGEQDFASFCGNPRMKKSTVRMVDHIGIEQRHGHLCPCQANAEHGQATCKPAPQSTQIPIHDELLSERRSNLHRWRFSRA